MPAGIAGLVATIGGGLASASAGVGGALAGLGIGADTAGIIGTGLVDAGVGAGTGALSSAVTGGNIGQGAEFGALSGGVGGAGGGLAANLGLNSGVGAALGGALGGAGASAISGSNPITGALLGGVSGFGANSLNPTGAGPAGPGGGVSAAATAAPGAVSAGGAAPDLTNVNVTPAASLGGTGSTSAALGLSPGTVSAGSPSLPPLDPSSLLLPSQTLPGSTSSGLFGTGITPGQAISGLGLAYSALKPEPGVEKQLQASANSLGAEGQSLMSYIQNGSLPPGLQESVNLASQDAIASIKSTYANLGASGSSSEAQAIADTKQRAQAQAGQYALSLLQSGIQTSGLSNQLLGGILSYDQSEDKDLTDALAGFAAAGSGGSTTPGFTVKGGA